MQKCVYLVLLSVSLATQVPPHLPPLDRALPPAAEVIYQAMAALSPRFETFTDAGMGWEQRAGTLRLGGPDGEVLLSRAARPA